VTKVTKKRWHLNLLFSPKDKHLNALNILIEDLFFKRPVFWNTRLNQYRQINLNLYKLEILIKHQVKSPPFQLRRYRRW